MILTLGNSKDERWLGSFTPEPADSVSGFILIFPHVWRVYDGQMAQRYSSTRSWLSLGEGENICYEVRGMTGLCWSWRCPSRCNSVLTMSVLKAMVFKMDPPFKDILRTPLYLSIFHVWHELAWHGGKPKIPRSASHSDRIAAATFIESSLT